MKSTGITRPTYHNSIANSFEQGQQMYHGLWETMINTTHAAESKQIIMSKSESLSQNLSEGRLQSCLSATLTMMLSSPMTGICLGVDMMIVSKLLVVLNMVIGFRGLILWTERSLWYWQSDSSWWEYRRSARIFSSLSTFTDHKFLPEQVSWFAHSWNLLHGPLKTYSQNRLSHKEDP